MSYYPTTMYLFYLFSYWNKALSVEKLQVLLFT